jgi:hypothetical protein
MIDHDELSDEHSIVWDKIVGIMIPLSKNLQNISFEQFKLRAKLSILQGRKDTTLSKEPRMSLDTLQKNLDTIKIKIDTFKDDYKKSMKEIDSIKEQYPSEKTVLVTDAAYENMEILLDYLNNKPPSYDKMQQEIATLSQSQISEIKQLDDDKPLNI